MRKSRHISHDLQNALQTAWIRAGFGLDAAVIVTRRVRIDLQVNETLGRYTTAYVMRGDIVIDSAHCYSPEDVIRLCSRIDGRSGQLTAEVGA